MCNNEKAKTPGRTHIQNLKLKRVEYEYLVFYMHPIHPIIKSTFVGFNLINQSNILTE